MNTALANKTPGTLQDVRAQVKAGDGAPAIAAQTEIPVAIGAPAPRQRD
jgi:hypothetical protein